MSIISELKYWLSSCSARILLCYLAEFSFAQLNTGNKIKENTRLVVSPTAVSCHLQYSLTWFISFCLFYHKKKKIKVIVLAYQPAVSLTIPRWLQNIFLVLSHENQELINKSYLYSGLSVLSIWCTQIYPQQLNIISFIDNQGTFYSFIHSFVFSLHAELLNCLQYLLFLYSWYFILYFIYFCIVLLQYYRVAWWTRPMNSVCIWVRAWSHSWCSLQDEDYPSQLQPCILVGAGFRWLIEERLHSFDCFFSYPLTCSGGFIYDCCHCAVKWNA